MSKYDYEGHKSFKITEEGERLLLANFIAEITKETRLVDGLTTETTLSIRGLMPGREPGDKPIELPLVEVPASTFPGMTWVMSHWGVRCVIQPGSGVKEDLRTAIQMSSTPTVQTIYRTIGWHPIDGQTAYLHAGGAITATGNDSSIVVRLPMELSRYSLTCEGDAATAFKASLALASMPPPNVGWPLWAATWAPIVRPG